MMADNAGEIVFDRDLLAQLPPGHVAVAVRGSPVLKDATVVDAHPAGLPEFCEIVSNGSDAPGTLLADCSTAFRERFAAADLVIAKGQGKYESLADSNKEIFFLLKIKCTVLSRNLAWPVGSLVLFHQQAAGATHQGDGDNARARGHGRGRGVRTRPACWLDRL